MDKLHGDIAVIGISCRFPGAENYNDYWDNLVNNKFSVTEIPADRWNWRDYYGNPLEEANKTNSKWGGFITGIDKFDPLFFNISPKEAKYIDPQHRIFLQAVWHAIEDAGYSTESLSGKKVGIYAGVSKNDYAEMIQATRQEISPFVSTGTVHSILANRVSFFLNLSGKSEVVDTACSSSLVALHNAIRDIRLGNCESAIVGGVNALITPTMYLSHGKSGMLSSEGKCKTFDEKSDGYVRAEGVGCLFIKPLDKAIADNDNIIGVIKGTGVNHNGRSNSLTSPSAVAQAEVITEALKDAGMEPSQISYIEAHGTATPLGDPIEISGLKKVFGKNSEPLGIGSVKTNVGHLESAAGMAGLIKVLLCMRHKQLPATLHFNKLNPYIDLKDSPFYVVDSLKEWTAKGPLSAGVSSFGMGGVNAHVILQEYVNNDTAVAIDSTFQFKLSARTKQQLQAYATGLGEFLQEHTVSLQDVAYTLETGRDVMAQQVSFTSADKDDLIRQLQQFAQDGIQPALNTASPAIGNRIALPGYPFEQRRCWIDVSVSSTYYTDTFTLQPVDYFVRDHIVQGTSLLPGVAYMEIARRIGQKAGRTVHGIADICWMQPVKVYEQPVELNVTIDQQAFEINTVAGLHASGNLLTDKTEAPARVDIAAIRQRCSIQKEQKEIYQHFQQEGLHYLSTFQTIQEGVFAADEALCTLAATQPGVWEPSLLDGVFQSVVGLCIWGDISNDTQLLPFYLTTMRCFGDLSKARYAYVRKAASYTEGSRYAFDMFLCNEQGEVLLSYSEFVKRAYQGTSMLYYTATWAERPLGVLAARPEGILLFDKDARLYEELCQTHANVTLVLPGAYQKVNEHTYHADKTSFSQLLKEIGTDNIVFRWEDIFDLLALSQALITSAYTGKIRLYYMYDHAATTAAAIQQMSGGFARTLYYENPRISILTLGVAADAAMTPALILQQEIARYATAPLREIIYRDTRREERIMVPAIVPAGKPSLLKEQGCYVITGGAGGLGMVFAAYLIEKYNANVVLIGRRASVGDKLDQYGGKAVYYSANVSDREAVSAVLAAVRDTHTTINGVIHAAGLIEDAFIINKKQDSFERVMTPKVWGAINMDECTKDDALDFFVVFSSIASLMPNQGQCDYAASNNFLDHLMQVRKQQQRSGLSMAINWPLWESGGIGVSDHEREHLWEVFGMKPMGNKEALEGFERLLQCDYPQLVMIEGVQHKIEKHLNVMAGHTASAIDVESMVCAVAKVDAIDEKRTFNALGIDSVGLVKLAQALEVNPITLIEYNTISSLREYLATAPARITSHFPKTSLVDAESSDIAGLSFQKRFSNEEFYMQDHVVEGKFNVPGACYIEMARQAGSLTGKPVYHLVNNYWPEVLSSAGDPIDAHIRLTPKGTGYEYEISSGNKTVHAIGEINIGEVEEMGKIDLSAIKNRISGMVAREQVYAQIIAEGLHVGPSFMPMEELWANSTEALGHLKLPLHVEDTLSDYILHPTLLTGVFQTALLNNKPTGIESSRFIPVAIDEIIFTAQLPGECYVHTVAHEANSRMSGVKKFDAVVTTIDGEIVARLHGFAIREITGVRQVAAATEIAGGEAIEQLLKELLYEGIGVEMDELDADVSFQEYGINSRMIIDLNQRLAKVFGNLSKTLFFEYQNIRELAGYFQQKHGAILQEHIKEEAPAPAAIVSSKDIAIVGIGGKYPQADNMDAFWEVLKNGQDCVTEIPGSRFDYEAHYDGNRGGDGLYSKWGGFINDVDKFDPLFFNISPRDAEKIDPQERLFLEVVWATLEDAGITRENIVSRSRKVGVFVGALWQPYVNLGVEATAQGNPVAPSGLLYSIPNRVSYFFNWTGPSVAIDTACSASLTALHYACESIRNGECDSCIAGGVNLSLSLSKYLFLSQNNFLSTDGRCRSFGIGDGYVPGEGIGAVLLKPLEDAIAAGDQIYGVIKGSGVNHGGRTNGYTVPSPNLQGELIADVLKKAEIHPGTISYVEAHGTGTSLGDPIEISGLCKAFEPYTQDKQFCAIGSVKSNIGHLEASAGIAGLSKILLQFKHQQLVPSLHSTTLNPNISFADTPFYVQQELSNWKRPKGQPYRAMLSSFGAGGSNAHIIVEEYQQPRTTVKQTGPAIIVLSALNTERLGAQLENLKAFLQVHPNLDLHDIAYTLQTGREALEERIAFVITDIKQLYNYSIKTVDRLPAKQLLKGEAARELVRRYKSDPEQIANLWMQGQHIDWALLYTDLPKRISLPTYAFARERYWLPVSNKATAKSYLHPLLHTNTSNLDQQQYTTVFTGEEKFLTNHKVRQVKILPGVASLEIARIAGLLGANRTVTQLKNVSWISPVWADKHQKLHTSLFREQDKVTYEIYSEAGVHNTGSLLFSETATPAPFNIQRLKREADRTIQAEEIYSTFDAAGLNLGMEFRQVLELYKGGTGVLTRINPVHEPGFMYPPAIIDSLLHAVYGLMDTYSLVLPYYAGEVNFYQPLDNVKELWGYAVSKDTTTVTADFYLLNEQGEVLLYLKDFIFLPTERSDNHLTYSQVEWQPVVPVSIEPAEHVILVAGGAADLCDKLQEALGQEVISLKQESAANYFSRVLEVIKAKKHVMLVCQHTDYADYAFVSGLLKTAHLENPAMTGKVLAVESLSVRELDTLVTIIEKEQACSGEEVRYYNGTREEKCLQPLQTAGAVQIREGGTYLVSGGGGVLGQLISHYIRQVKGTRVILIGRSNRPDLGVDYHRCDSCDAVAIQALVKKLNTPIHGVIHCAGVIRDSYIVNKTTAHIQEVLAAKIQGIINLDEATKDQPLDFMILFSSVTGWKGNVGQADYAAANAFLDNYATNRNAGRRSGKTLSINWPLWQEGGMQVDADTSAYLEKHFGTQALSNVAGMAAFDVLLRTAAGQVLVTCGKPAQKITTVTNNTASHEEVAVCILDIMADILKMNPANIKRNKAFGDYGFDSISLTRFSKALNAQYSLELLPTVFYNHPTVEELTAHLADLVPAETAKPVAMERSRPTRSTAPVPGNDAVAIVGMSGRFPGSPDLATFWKHLRDNKDLITEIPADRWDWMALYGDPLKEKNKTKAKWGGFISDIDKFDPLFFGISPTEAELMDPQQRITLEAVYQAFDDAGIAADKIRGTNTGVFIGVSTFDYSNILNIQTDLAGQAHYATGSVHSVLVNRISYLLDLYGPSEPVDTACSSSLIAIHRAAEHIRSGRCTMAVAGGVNALLSPELTLSFSEAGMLSDDGRCKTFDQSANGYVRGEGVGVLVLKSLQQAEADGDHIYAIVRGTAENHGGKANTLTSPNPKAQRALLVQAYTNAGVDPRDVSYIEAHGTGTPLGDPIEAEGLKLAFKSLGAPDQSYIALGSVKTNIGHLEAAAGVAGVIKVLLAMQHRELPGNPHLQVPNEYLKLNDSPFYLLQQTKPWNSDKRIAGISSFGFGGANAHVIIEEYIPANKPFHTSEPATIILSARTAERLKEKVQQLKAFITAHPATDIHSLAYTLQVGREAMDHRMAVVAADNNALLAALDGQVTTLNETARQWLAGEEVNWLSLYPGDKPAKISLPAYPFARNRYWLPTGTKVQQSTLHPLLHTNESDLNEQRYTSTFTGSESFLADHIVNGEKILPGVAYLELARAAGTLASHQQVVQLQHVSWVSPIKPGKVSISLKPGISFEITTEGQVHSSGTIITGDTLASPIMDLEYLKRICTKEKTGIYDVFYSEGLHLGNSFRGVKALYTGEQGALSKIVLPVLDGCAYTPGILDSLLHTIAGLVDPYTLALPYFVKEVNFYKPITAGEELYGYARKSKASGQQVISYDLDLLNAAGEVLFSLREFTALSPKGMVVVDEPTGTVVTNTAISEKIREVVAQLVKVDLAEVASDRKFGDYGFDSVLLTRFANALNTQFNTDLVPTAFYNYPTVNKLAAFLESTEVKPVRQVTKTRFQPAPASSDAVAIIGISGRFPGSPDVHTFWDNIRQNKDLITEIPADRWDWQKYDGDPQKEKNKTRAKWGGFISDMDKFDALFFGISPREAELMDPQQRILLEAVYHALEDAAVAQEQLKGSNTGVFIGVSGSDYAHLLDRQTDLAGHMHFTTGSVHSILVNRISYLLDLYGPSEPIDTACSSSLIAIHRAVENIRSGLCTMAIAGGVNALISPELTLSFSHAGMLSEDGRCKTFDQRANGYVRGEGVGVVILKSLRQAEADGDHIYAVIRGTAENHGGKANTLTSPNPAAQKELLLHAYRTANIDPRDVGYIEAHGTGTPLGDPIEAEGLKLAFKALFEHKGLPVPEQPYIGLGSVKTNIGHLEAAAGIAGVMKVLLAMQHGILPGNPHLTKPNEYLHLQGSPFFLMQETMPWNNHKRIAGISSFGFGGANAHIILEQYQPGADTYSSDQPAIIVLSAKDKGRLAAQVRQLQQYTDPNIHALAYTLQTGREMFEERLAFTARDQQQLQQRLSAYLSGDHKELFTGSGKPSESTTHDGNIPAAWAAGVRINWQTLYPQGHPVKRSLPGYPFARHSYWVPAGHAPKATTRQLHPLLHINESDLVEQLYTSIYTGEEIFLRDHKVRDEKILPGVAYLEMARMAGTLSTRTPVTSIRNVSWVNPIRVSTGEEKIQMAIHADGYDVFSTREGEEVIHSSGTLYTGSIPALDRLDLARLKAAASVQLNGADMYEVFRNEGLQLGSSYRGVQEMYAHRDGCLSRIHLPVLEGCLYTPGILDSMLHTVYGMLSASGVPYTLMLPYSLAAADFHQAPVGTVWAYARKGKAGYDIDLLNEEGETLVSFRDFVALPLTRQKHDAHLYAYDWTDTALTSTNNNKRQLVWLAGSDTKTAGHLQQQTGMEVTALPAATPAAFFATVFEKIKTLLKSDNIQVTVVYKQPLEYGFIAGLLKTATQEGNNITGKTICVDTMDDLAQVLKAEQGNSDAEVRYQKGVRQTKTLSRLTATAPAATIRENGVYLITGGAGGLGHIFAAHIRRTKGAKVILVGRSAQALEDYYTCDISDHAAVQQLVQTITAKYGPINGVIHSAGAIRDSFILNKTAAQFDEVINPKILGVQYLDEATREQPLDFMILFSSIAGVMGNAAQADYAAANAYLDHYAQHRRGHGKTISINWPLWKDGGMQVNEAVEKYLETKWGMLPMPTATGLAVFDDLLRQRAGQCVVFFGKDLVKTAPVAIKKVQTGGITSVVAQLLKMDVAQIDPQKEFGDYGFDSVLLTSFSNTLNSVYGLDLTPATFYAHPTIDTLAAFLSEAYADKFSEEQEVAPVIAPVVPVRSRRRAVRAVPTTTAPVAIIGMSGRFPGSPDLAAFWKNLYENKDLITEVPADRWDWKALFGDPKKDKHKTKAKWGGFITDIDKFDPSFFNISPREAELMDPQQRIALEAVYQALDDAGISTQQIKGSNTAVFVGVSGSDYTTLLSTNQALVNDAQFPTGTAHSVLVNRISHLLDLHGPSEPVDTACSSALIAIHRAVELIRNGQCEMAIAGGVNAMLSPELTLSFTQAGMLGDDGRCRAFDHRANGYVRGEGVGMVILKSLARAEEDGDHIYAVINGSAENHGGKANTLTSPNPNAQRDLLLKAYRQAGVDPRDVSYIEAHGTGTPLGDPIEAEGLKLAFKALYQDRNLTATEAPYCGIGSVKANVGHLESAAGMSAIIKVLLAIKHRTLPGNPQLESPNEYLHLQGSPFFLMQETMPWNSNKRIAGISSFGFGGANAHIIVEEYIPAPRIAPVNNAPLIILLSAKNKARLKDIAVNLRTFILENDNVSIADIAYTLQTGRAPLEERLSLVVSDSADLVQHLEQYIAGNASHWFSGNVKEDKTDFLLEGEAGKGYIRIAIEQQESRSLAQLWVKGIAIDWQLLYTGGRPNKVSLPAYPFARERYWVPNGKTTLQTGSSQLHPLLHRNESDLNSIQYHSTYTGQEIFLSDHIVRKIKVLPGVAYLELARIAGALSTRSKVTMLKNITWLYPLSIDAPEKAVRVTLTPQDQLLNFEVYSGKDTLHSTGIISVVDMPTPAGINIRQLISDAHAQVEGTTVYDLFRSEGLDLGITYRGVKVIYVGHDTALSEIELPHADGFMYAPGILDSLLHTTYGLVSTAYSLALPYYMGEVRFYKELRGGKLFGYARKSEYGYHIDLLDEQGEVLVSLRDFVALPIDGTTAKHTLTVYQPAWVPTAVDADKEAAPVQLLILAGGNAALADGLQATLGIEVVAINTDNQITYFNDLLQRIRQLVNSQVQVTVVCQHTDISEYGFITGLLRTAARESTRFAGKLLLADTLLFTELEQLIIAEQENSAVEVSYINGERFVKHMQPITLSAGDEGGIKEGGVYLITGGMGALGQLFAAHIRRTRNTTVILTGRRELPGVQDYYACDLNSLDAVTALYNTIKARYKKLDGVIHAAGVIHDSLLVNKTAKQVDEVLQPKITGLRHLDEVTKDAGLDFMVLFSSISAVFGNAGQGDYAAANSFMDLYKSRAGKTLSINWPLWKEGGMHISEEQEQYMAKQYGMHPMPADIGLAIFDKILTQPSGQYAVLYGSEKRISDMLSGTPVVEKAKTVVPGQLEKIKQEVIAGIAGLLKIDREKVKGNVPFGEYGLDSVLLTQFASKLNAMYQLELVPTVFFNYPTVDELTEWLAGNIEVAVQPEVPVRMPVRLPVVVPTTGVAIVGISGRFPGSPDVNTFWENIKQNKDLITEIPADRWDWKEYYGDPAKGVRKTKAKWGGFIKDIDKFDPLFFNISPKEAALMDPQQRIALEAVYQALEDAGIATASLKGTDTGVFIGVSGADYSTLLNEGLDTVNQAQYATGAAHSVLVNRISYLLDIHGPSEPVDTACSSSLIAIHRAVEHILHGHCGIAIAGGVNAILSPELTLSFSQAGMLSEDGRCKTFDQSANGYVRGEGVGIVILKSLAAAQADGDHIYGIIRGTAENHGGRANTLTSPNPKAQRDLLVKAYRLANVDPRDITYIEAHGTGTALGDPIEVEGLKLAFNQLYSDRKLGLPDLAYCYIGSVKTNIGHLESAAGIAGVIKVLMAMQHKMLPGNPHLHSANSYLQLDNSPFMLLKDTIPWKSKKKIAGVSSFGFGGANAHVIIEAYGDGDIPVFEAPAAAIIPLSAKNNNRLLQQVINLLNFLQSGTPAGIHHIARTLQDGRDAMQERLVFIADSTTTLIALLEEFTIEKRLYMGAGTHEQRLLAESWLSGVAADWSVCYPGEKPAKVRLPLYPFARERYWVPGQQEVVSIEPDTDYLYTCEWTRMESVQMQPVQPGRHLVLTGGSHTLVAAIQQYLNAMVMTNTTTLPADFTDLYLLHGLSGQPAAELAVFRIIKQLLASVYVNQQLNITVFTAGTQQVLPADRVSAVGSGLPGLIGSLAKEQSNWRFRVIDIAQNVPVDVPTVLNSPFNIDDVMVGYRNGHLYQRDMYQLDLPVGNAGKLKSYGTYVLLGGAGGIGRTTSAYLVEKYQAQVIWLGRRPMDNIISQAQDEIERLGIRPIYIQCDANNEMDVINALSAIKKAGLTVNGIFHAGIVLNDQLLRNMSEDEFVQSFSIKSQASHHLVETFKCEPLDFICFYSSVQSQWNAPGQANYSAGCTYKDSYGHSLKHTQSTPVHIINWGYLGAPDHKEQMEKMGIGSITPKAGMDILELVLANNESQVAAVKFV